MGLKTLRFESDSAQLVKTVNEETGTPELQDILDCISAFEFVSFVWIPRERNTMADLLAKDVLNALGHLVVVGTFNGLN